MSTNVFSLLVDEARHPAEALLHALNHFRELAEATAQALRARDLETAEAHIDAREAMRPLIARCLSEFDDWQSGASDREANGARRRVAEEGARCAAAEAALQEQLRSLRDATLAGMPLVRRSRQGYQVAVDGGWLDVQA